VWPIDVVSADHDREVIDAAIAAVRSRDVWVAPPDRRARLVLVAPADRGDAARNDPTAEAAPIQRPWMADAIARMTRDPDLRAVAIRSKAGLSDRRFAVSPWQALAIAADGRPLAAAAGSADHLLVASAAGASSLGTPVVLRSIANAIASPPDLQRAEVIPIADDVIRQWSRPPAPVVSPRIDTVERDDRRWLWLAVLLLLALETWMRHAQPTAVERRAAEHTRVA
jgi:hypothetical protein